MEDLASQAEESAHKEEQGQVYKITTLISSRYHGATDTRRLWINREGYMFSPRKQNRRQDGESISAKF